MATEAGKFNKKSYDSNDNYGKNILLNFLKGRGHNIIFDGENYEHDIITEYKGKRYYYEVEIKRNYPFTNVDNFKFSSVSFLARKKRLHDIHEFNYVIICHETNYAIICNSKDIYKDKYAESLYITSRDRIGNDEFYRIPKQICTFFKIR